MRKSPEVYPVGELRAAHAEALVAPSEYAKRISRLDNGALNARVPDLRVTVDNATNVAALDAAAKAAGKPLQVLIDIDPGIRRTGVPSPEVAVEVGQSILDDADFDGAGNLAEFVLGSDPLNPASRPRIQFLDDGGLYKVTWQRNRFAISECSITAGASSMSKAMPSAAPPSRIVPLISGKSLPHLRRSEWRHL